MEKYSLKDGLTLPKIGFGTWQLTPNALASHTVKYALEAGYRLIDTASMYDNERGVGDAIKSSHLNREDIIVCTKLAPSDMGYNSAMVALDTSLARLGLDYVDIYLIHQPGDDSSARQDSWRALEAMRLDGRVKSIGVSNYRVEHLKELYDSANTVPAINQIELHPFNYRIQKPIIDYCQERGILIEAYSPLAKASMLDNQVLREIAQQYNKSPAQIMLSWSIHHGALPIPKSSNPSRIKQNFQLADIELNKKDVQKLDNLSY